MRERVAHLRADVGERAHRPRAKRVGRDQQSAGVSAADERRIGADHLLVGAQSCREPAGVIQPGVRRPPRRVRGTEEQMDGQGCAEFVSEEAEAVHRERLQQHRRAGVGPWLIEPGGLQLGEHRRLDARIPLGCLQLDEQTGPPADRRDGLGQRRDARAGEARVVPTAGVEAAHLGECEVVERPLASRLALHHDRPGAFGEDLLDIGGALERGVVQEHQGAVPGSLQVELDEGGPLLGREHERRNRVLGRVGGCPAMGHHPRRWWRRAGRRSVPHGHGAGQDDR